MMLSELINALEKIYAEQGNIPVLTGCNEWLTLDNIEVSHESGNHTYYQETEAPVNYVLIDSTGWYGESK